VNQATGVCSPCRRRQNPEDQDDSGEPTGLSSRGVCGVAAGSADGTGAVPASDGIAAGPVAAGAGLATG
jgi:hypothetical protein